MLIGNYKSSYKSDESIFVDWPNKFSFLIICISLLVVPFVSSGYFIFLITQVSIFVIAVVGLNILTGYTGLVSLGHGALVGVGAYSTAIFQNQFDFSFWLNIPLAILTTSFIGVFFGLPSLRIRGLYLTISTLAASFIIIFILRNWDSLTGGDSGVILNPIEIFGYAIVSDTQKYFFILPITIVSILFAQNLLRTRLGRAFIAIRDADLSAEIIGVNIINYKLLAFALGAAYAGLAGSLWAYNFLAVLIILFVEKITLFVDLYFFIVRQ